MRAADTNPYTPAYEINKSIDSFIIAKVLCSNSNLYKEGDLVLGQ